MGLREAVRHTIAAGDLRQSAVHEAGADQMGAMALTREPLGAALWRILDDHDAIAYQRALQLLVLRVRPRGGHHGRSIYAKICRQVLNEWLDNKCRRCAGRGYMVAENEVKSTCTVCDGTRLRRPSDAERMRETGLDRRAYPKWEKIFGEAHRTLSDADTLHGRRMGRQLRRGFS